MCGRGESEIFWRGGDAEFIVAIAFEDGLDDGIVASFLMEEAAEFEFCGFEQGAGVDGVRGEFEILFEEREVLGGILEALL